MDFNDNRPRKNENSESDEAVPPTKFIWVDRDIDTNSSDDYDLEQRDLQIVYTEEEETSDQVHCSPSENKIQVVEDKSDILKGDEAVVDVKPSANRFEIVSNVNNGSNDATTESIEEKIGEDIHSVVKEERIEHDEGDRVPSFQIGKDIRSVVDEQRTERDEGVHVPPTKRQKTIDYGIKIERRVAHRPGYLRVMPPRPPPHACINHPAGNVEVQGTSKNIARGASNRRDRKLSRFDRILKNFRQTNERGKSRPGARLDISGRRM